MEDSGIGDGKSILLTQMAQMDETVFEYTSKLRDDTCKIFKSIFGQSLSFQTIYGCLLKKQTELSTLLVTHIDNITRIHMNPHSGCLWLLEGVLEIMKKTKLPYPSLPQTGGEMPLSELTAILACYGFVFRHYCSIIIRTITVFFPNITQDPCSTIHLECEEYLFNFLNEALNEMSIELLETVNAARCQAALETDSTDVVWQILYPTAPLCRQARCFTMSENQLLESILLSTVDRLARHIVDDIITFLTTSTFSCDKKWFSDIKCVETLLNRAKYICFIDTESIFHNWNICPLVTQIIAEMTQFNDVTESLLTTRISANSLSPYFNVIYIWKYLWDNHMTYWDLKSSISHRSSLVSLDAIEAYTKDHQLPQYIIELADICYLLYYFLMKEDTEIEHYSYFSHLKAQKTLQQIVLTAIESIFKCYLKKSFLYRIEKESWNILLQKQIIYPMSSLITLRALYVIIFPSLLYCIQLFIHDSIFEMWDQRYRLNFKKNNTICIREGYYRISCVYADMIYSTDTLRSFFLFWDFGKDLGFLLDVCDALQTIKGWSIFQQFLKHVLELCECQPKIDSIPSINNNFLRELQNHQIQTNDNVPQQPPIYFLEILFQMQRILHLIEIIVSCYGQYYFNKLKPIHSGFIQRYLKRKPWISLGCFLLIDKRLQQILKQDTLAAIRYVGVYFQCTFLQLYSQMLFQQRIALSTTHNIIVKKERIYSQSYWITFTHRVLRDISSYLCWTLLSTLITQDTSVSSCSSSHEVSINESPFIFILDRLYLSLQRCFDTLCTNDTVTKMQQEAKELNTMVNNEMYIHPYEPYYEVVQHLLKHDVFYYRIPLFYSATLIGLLSGTHSRLHNWEIEVSQRDQCHRILNHPHFSQRMATSLSSFMKQIEMNFYCKELLQWINTLQHVNDPCGTDTHFILLCYKLLLLCIQGNAIFYPITYNPIQESVYPPIYFRLGVFSSPFYVCPSCILECLLITTVDVDDPTLSDLTELQSTHDILYNNRSSTDLTTLTSVPIQDTIKDAQHHVFNVKLSKHLYHKTTSMIYDKDYELYTHRHSLSHSPLSIKCHCDLHLSTWIIQQFGTLQELQLQQRRGLAIQLFRLFVNHTHNALLTTAINQSTDSCSVSSTALRQSMLGHDRDVTFGKTTQRRMGLLHPNVLYFEKPMEVLFMMMTDMRERIMMFAENINRTQKKLKCEWIESNGIESQRCDGNVEDVIRLNENVISEEKQLCLRIMSHQQHTIRLMIQEVEKLSLLLKDALQSIEMIGITLYQHSQVDQKQYCSFVEGQKIGTINVIHESHEYTAYHVCDPFYLIDLNDIRHDDNLNYQDIIETDDCVEPVTDLFPMKPQDDVVQKCVFINKKRHKSFQDVLKHIQLCLEYQASTIIPEQLYHLPLFKSSVYILQHISPLLTTNPINKTYSIIYKQPIKHTCPLRCLIMSEQLWPKTAIRTEMTTRYHQHCLFGSLRLNYVKNHQTTCHHRYQSMQHTDAQHLELRLSITHPIIHESFILRESLTPIVVLYEQTYPGRTLEFLLSSIYVDLTIVKLQTQQQTQEFSQNLLSDYQLIQQTSDKHPSYIEQLKKKLGYDLISENEQIIYPTRLNPSSRIIEHKMLQHYTKCVDDELLKLHITTQETAQKVESQSIKSTSPKFKHLYLRLHAIDVIILEVFINKENNQTLERTTCQPLLFNDIRHAVPILLSDMDLQHSLQKLVDEQILCKCIENSHDVYYYLIQENFTPVISLDYN